MELNIFTEVCNKFSADEIDTAENASVMENYDELAEVVEMLIGHRVYVESLELTYVDSANKTVTAYITTITLLDVPIFRQDEVAKEMLRQVPQSVRHFRQMSLDKCKTFSVKLLKEMIAHVR